MSATEKGRMEKEEDRGEETRKQAQKIKYYFFWLVKFTLEKIYFIKESGNYFKIYI